MSSDQPSEIVPVVVSSVARGHLIIEGRLPQQAGVQIVSVSLAAIITDSLLSSLHL